MWMKKWPYGIKKEPLSVNYVMSQSSAAIICKCQPELEIDWTASMGAIKCVIAQFSNVFQKGFKESGFHETGEKFAWMREFEKNTYYFESKTKIKTIKPGNENEPENLKYTYSHEKKSSESSIHHSNTLKAYSKSKLIVLLIKRTNSDKCLNSWKFYREMATHSCVLNLLNLIKPYKMIRNEKEIWHYLHSTSRNQDGGEQAENKQGETTNEQNASPFGEVILKSKQYWVMSEEDNSSWRNGQFS